MEIINNDWKEYFNIEFQKDYFQSLNSFVETEYKEKTCYPPKEKIFAAFEKCSFNNTKVVIIGQDPYHNFGQANGLSFSVSSGTNLPPSLKNILKEINNDIGTSIIKNGDLNSWAEQGVLLLNSILSVQENSPGSHKNKGWETFTYNIIETLNSKKDNLVFLLWGTYAKEKGKKIDSKKHLVLHAAHPSPLSANKGGWFGNKHFSQSNEYLISKNLSPIKW